jgi:hypothetical protein
VLGGDEVYVCAGEAAAVVKVVLWRTRQSPKVLELEAAPHSCLAHAVIGASSLSSSSARPFHSLHPNYCQHNEACKTIVPKMAFYKMHRNTVPRTAER